MPLNCDCYEGCWGAHSENWARVSSDAVSVDEIWRRCQKILPYGTYVKMGTHVRIEPGYDTTMVVNRLLDNVWIDYPTDHRTVTLKVNINAMDAKAFVEKLLAPEPPRHAWEQDGDEWTYIDVKDQRILGEVYCPRSRPNCFCAGGYLNGGHNPLGRFTSLARAKQAVEEASRPPEKLLTGQRKVGL